MSIATRATNSTRIPGEVHTRAHARVEGMGTRVECVAIIAPDTLHLAGHID
jgi:hypothetical protein